MKRRPRRATIGAVALGTSLVAILAVAYRDTVRDHVEAWHFQLTRETETFDPFIMTPARLNEEGVLVCPSPGLQILATYSRRSIISARTAIASSSNDSPGGPTSSYARATGNRTGKVLCGVE